MFCSGNQKMQVLIGPGHRCLEIPPSILHRQGRWQTRCAYYCSDSWLLNFSFLMWPSQEVSSTLQLSSVQSFSRVQLLQPHEPQHARPTCPSPTPGVYPNSCPLSRWCHLTISSSVVPFSSCPPSFPTSGSFPKNQLFTSGGQNIRVSASTSVLPMNIQDWSPLGWTGWISL